MRTFRWTSAARAAVAAATIVFAGACSDFAKFVTPGREDATPPARIAFTASVAQNIGTRADVVSLRVTATYARKNGSRAALGLQTVILSDIASQQVPLSIDIGPCVRDADHQGGTGGDASCVVYLAIELLVNSNPIDQSTLGPLNLQPGVTQNVTDPVALYEIASLGVARAGGTVLGPTERVNLLVGGTVALEAQLRDVDQKLVSGRTVVWTTDAAGIATVSTSGVVTGVAQGTVHITAASSGLTATATVDVARPPVPITVSAATSTGSGTITSAPAGINCRITSAGTTGTCTSNFVADGQVLLTATPDANMQFGPWSDMCAASGSGATCTLAMTQARTVGARFSALRRVTVTGTGPGNGRVTSVPAGIDCQLTGAATTGTCFFDVVDGTSVTLTAAASAQQVLLGWANDCAAAVGTACTLNVTGASRTAGVRFAGPQSLTVTPTGTGGGTVTGTGGVSCVRAQGNNTGVCTANYAFNSVVALTATADGNSSFSGWTGACAGVLITTCNVTMDQARTVGVAFSSVQVQLQLTLNGAGAGKVVLDGATTCTKTVQDASVACSIFASLGATVQLVATPTAGSSFTGYSGACSGVTTTCNVLMNSAKTVTATFGVAQVQVSVVNFAGAQATGTITSAGNAINCTLTLGVATGTCVTSVAPGTPITLTATPNSSSALISWNGACLGEPTTHCLVVPQTSTSLSARFNAGVTVDVEILAYGTGKLTYTAPQFPKLDDCVIPVANSNGVHCIFQAPVGANVTIDIDPDGAGYGLFESPCGAQSFRLCFTATTPRSEMGYIFPSGGSELRRAPSSAIGRPAYGPIKRPPNPNDR